MEAGGGKQKQRIHEAAIEGGGRQEQKLRKAAVAGDVDTLTEILDGDPNFLDMVKIAMASDDAPHDDVLPIIVTEGDVRSPVPEVDILAPATGVEGHGKDSMVEDIEAEPEPLSLRTRRFDLMTYRPCTHTMALGEMLRFTEFSQRVAEDVLLQERTRHLSHESFMNIRSSAAVLESDARLYDDEATRCVVDSYFDVLSPLFGPFFETDFVNSIVKMGQIDVKIGTFEREVRRVCGSFN
ncbi:Peroxidase 43 [Camellia lanceoleosa]|uniref:Peroxidase 43 n=1 Tax=Camellia lanceoleosa TaxID=1840588 RepID=A0ACC0ICB6_9ERIC|nr:Peroxidase 43 [Camellia lanceoleosa]